MLLTELLSRKSLVLSAKNLSLSPFWLETAKPGLARGLWVLPHGRIHVSIYHIFEANRL